VPLVERDDAVRGAIRLSLRVEACGVSVAGPVAKVLARLREPPSVALLASVYRLGGQDSGTQAIAAKRGLSARGGAPYSQPATPRARSANPPSTSGRRSPAIRSAPTTT
jgi:hypothetical protein